MPTPLLRQLEQNTPTPKSSGAALLLQPNPPGSARLAAQALYLHVPFCFHKCHYCDFYSIVETGQDRQEVFTRRLIAELEYRAAQVELRPATIFVGGGTPTLLRPELWRELLAAMRGVGVLERATEFTVEANPETVTPELMDILVAGGVNRVSIGAQSFDPHLLKTLERWHDPANVAKAVKTVRSAGIDNFNLDLIFATPGQTLETLRVDLDAALALEPTHLSCYGLTYEPNTAMTQRLKMGQITPTDEDLEREMYALVMDTYDAAGFEHYEISNWARRGFRVQGSGEEAEGEARGKRQEARGGAGVTFSSSFSSLNPEPRTLNPSLRCAHNMAYWTNLNWIGLGPAAASHMDGRRWKNQPHLGAYLEHQPDPPVVDFEFLSPERRVGEMLMLGLRLRQGVDESWVNENLPADDARHSVIFDLMEIGMIERAEGHLRLTRDGVFVADAVIGKLL